MTKLDLARILALGLTSIWACSGDAGNDANVASAPADGGALADGANDAPSTPPSVDASRDALTDVAVDAAPSDPRDAPGVFVGVGNAMRHVRSLDDGKTWIDDATDITSPSGGDADGIRNVVWGNDRFVAFAAKLFESPDGKTWTNVPKDGQWLASMLYAQGQYVSSGGYGWLATATSDLGTWTQHPPSADYTAAHHSRLALAHGVVLGKDAYVVVDDLGNLFHSADVQAWVRATSGPIVPAGNTWGTSLVFGGAVFVGVLPSGDRTMRSTDGGVTWTENAPLATTVTGVAYAQGHFTLLGQGHVYTSIDGQAFTDHAESTALAADVTYGHGTYLAVTGGAIYRSTDGLTWSNSLPNDGNPEPIAAVAFGPIAH